MRICRSREIATAIGTIAIVMSACNQATQPSLAPGDSTTTGPGATASAATPAAPSPTPAAPTVPAPPSGARYADSFTIGFVFPGLSGLSNDALNESLDGPTLGLLPFIYDTLYRYDDHWRPVPSLADGPCSVTADKLTITCGLRAATFHDGTGLTADDVVLTYQLAFSAVCPFACVLTAGNLEDVRALESQTVTFRLKRPAAGFFDDLSLIAIEPKHVLEAERTAIAAGIAKVGPEVVRAAGTALGEGLDQQHALASPDCDNLVPPAVEVATRIGFRWALRLHQKFENDPCRDADNLRFFLDRAVGYLDATNDVDQLAWLHPTLMFNREPFGSGPYRVEGDLESGTVTLRAFERYFRGVAATPTIHVVVYPAWDEAITDLRDGSLDWIPKYGGFGDPSGWPVAREVPGLQFVTAPSAFAYTLYYNLRPGRLFSDQRLRKAVELCVDKASVVDSATDGDGTTIYSDVPPDSWASDPELPRPQRDVPEANRLIAAAGWTIGPDGVYEKGASRLSTTVIVSKDFPQRRKFMELVAFQLRDCGIDLTITPLDFQAFRNDVLHWPHVPPGQEEPFDMYFGGVFTGPFGNFDSWTSGQITSAEQPKSFNYVGFSNAEFDRLVAEGNAAYDIEVRAVDFHRAQRILATEAAALFAWNATNHVALRQRITSTAGPLNLRSGRWFWQPETLVMEIAP